MAAQIIPFPKLQTVNDGMVPASVTKWQQGETRPHPAATQLHIVRPSDFGRTQQTALRIVEDVCQELRLPHPALASAEKYSAAFWATLPIPPARVETPLSVAKRLAHMILPMVELA